MQNQDFANPLRPTSLKSVGKLSNAGLSERSVPTETLGQQYCNKRLLVNTKLFGDHLVSNDIFQTQYHTLDQS
jgi:hypothetical protein